MKLLPTRRVDQAITILGCLHSQSERAISAETIANSTGIGAASIRQLLRLLGREQVVGSRSGPQGGYWLNGTPAEINMRTIVEACEGSIDATFCELQGVRCDLADHCALHALWVTAQQSFADDLSKFSLKDIMNCPPDGDGGPIPTGNA
jgi:Rrf2 family protein